MGLIDWRNEMRDEFEVRPLSTYNKARYPSTWYKPQNEEQECRLNIAQLMVLFILVLGLTSGLIGCLADYKNDSCDPGLIRDENGNCVGPDPNDCRPGEIVCQTGDTLATCNADGKSWTSQDCHSYCQPDDGGMPGYSEGCDVNAEDPCQCQYDIVLGVMYECTPGEFACWDDDTVAFCDEDSWSWTEWNCDDYCTETLGEYSFSRGCNDEADDPCQCEYDIVDGDIAECTPGDFVSCKDEETAFVCDDNSWSWSEIECAEYCTDNFGSDYYSTGCDAESEDNFCGCEYGIVDGEPVDP